MRTETWQADFWTAIEDARSTPFQWGDHDCVMFAARMVDVLQGTDYVAQAKDRLPYATKDEALALMEANGGITGIVESFLSPAVNWGQAMIGDIVLVGKIPLLTDMDMLCVHDGVQLVAPTERGGLAAIPFRYAQKAWLIR